MGAPRAVVSRRRLIMGRRLFRQRCTLNFKGREEKRLQAPGSPGSNREVLKWDGGMHRPKRAGSVVMEAGSWRISNVTQKYNVESGREVVNGAEKRRHSTDFA